MFGARRFRARAKSTSLRLRLIERLELRRLLAVDFGPVESGSYETAAEVSKALTTRPLIQWDQRGAGTNQVWTVDTTSAPITEPFQTVEFDALTRTERVLSVEESLAAQEQLADIEKALNTQGFAGIADFLNALKQPPGSQAEDAGSDFSTSLIFGTDGRTEVTNTTVYPWRAMGRLWIDNNGTGNCSGTMVGPFQFLTAGHCVHDGPGANGWAENLVVSAGQTGDAIGSDFRRSDYQFYGEANWTSATTFTGWTADGNWDWDIALVRLDRNLGNQVGWLGYGWNSSNSFYTGTSNTAGYPGDLTPNEYDMWFNSGNAGSHSVTTHSIRSNTMDIWGGQSGSSLYYCIPDCATLRSAHAVVSHETFIDSNNDGDWDPGETPIYNSFTRITEGKFNSIGGWMNSNPAPTDRPDLIAWDQWFDATTASMSTSSVRPGSSFSVTTYPRNNGTATTGNYTVSFYASSNTVISTGDYLLGSVSMSALTPFNWSTATLSLTSFPDIPVGTYYVGWIIDSGNAVTEYLEGNNNGHITNATLQVRKALPDSMTTAEGTANFFSGASSDIVNDTLSFDAFIDITTDVDSYYFATDNTGTYTIDVGDYGNAVDPMVAVYNAATGAKLAWDNDAGPDDDARLSISLNSWTRYIIAVADYSQSNTGDVSISIVAPGANAKSPVTIDSSTGQGSSSSVIDNVADTDYFIFTAPVNSQGMLNVSVSPAAALNTNIVLWNAATGEFLASSNNGGVGGTDTLSFSGVLPGAQYQLAVHSFNFLTQGTFTVNLAFALDSTAPTITGVYAGSSTWTAAFMDTIDGGGAGGGNGLGFQLAAASLPLPWTTVNRIYVQFSEAVAGVNASNIELRDSNQVLPISVSYNLSTFMATITLPTPLTFSKLRLALADSITDTANNSLDGDNAGGAGGMFNLRFDVLPGDTNGDGRMNGQDVTGFANVFNSIAGQGAYQPRFDWNADGRVNATDIAVATLYFNSRLSDLAEPGAPFAPGLAGGSRSDRPFDFYFDSIAKDDDDDKEDDALGML
jgi:V8-like Glu-specific endopeptidase